LQFGGSGTGFRDRLHHQIRWDRGLMKGRPMRQLTSREQAFIAAYVGECQYNGAKAATAAGYSKRSAAVTASRLLTKANVQAELTDRLMKAGNRADLSAV